MSNDNQDRLLSEPEAASFLGLSTWTVRRWRLEGKLSAVKMGHRSIRYRQSDLELFLKKSTTSAK
jgi:excisionase family DNA binding protein